MFKNFSTPPFGGLLRQVLFYLPFLSSITAAFFLLMISFRLIVPWELLLQPWWTVYNRSFSSASINDSDQLQVNNLGSGVIMTKDGYILTNKHVIQNADQIVVALQNGNIYEANLIGSDNWQILRY